MAIQSPPIVPGNIDLWNRPRVTNPDGTVSTVRSISVSTPSGVILIPTVSDDGRIMGNEEAIASFRQSGKHLGIFRDEQSAEQYARQIHEQQSTMIGYPGATALQKILELYLRRQ